MKKKKDFKPIIIITLVIILGIIIFLYNSSGENNQQLDSSENSTTITSEATVERKTITNTSSASGEIKSSLEEKIELHATYYFKEIYFETNEYIKEGENILQYTNGTYLKAPYNLIIVNMSIPEINSQCTNSHYIEVYATDTLTMDIDISEEQLSNVKIGQEVDIKAIAYSEKTYKGYITKINNEGTYSSKGTTYTCIVTFENDDNLKIGMSASANIILEKAENVLAVSIEAITEQNNKKYVTVIKENNQTEAVNVETGISNDAYIEIKSGLSENEKIQITKQEKTNSNFLQNNFDRPQMEGQGMQQQPQQIPDIKMQSQDSKEMPVPN